MNHRYPELYLRLKSLVDTYHLDAHSLSLSHKVEGGYYDFSSSGYIYSFTLNNQYYVSIEAEYDILMPRVNYTVQAHALPNFEKLFMTIIFNDDLVVKILEHRLMLKLFLFG
jgi:hypothetical protein